MRNSICLALSLFILAGLLWVPHAAHATGIFNITSATYYCDGVEITVEHQYYSVFYLKITDSGGADLSDVVTVTDEDGNTSDIDTVSVTVNLTSSVPEGTTLQIHSSSGFGFFMRSSGTCTDRPVVEPEPETPGTTPTTPTTTTPSTGTTASEPALPRLIRYRLGELDARYDLFVVEDNNGANNPVLTFYYINPDRSGTFTYYISKKQLEQMFETPPNAITLIFASPDGKFKFYALPGGFYQVNVGPNSEGEEFVFGFKGVPPTNIYRSSFFVTSFQPLLWVASQF